MVSTMSGMNNDTNSPTTSDTATILRTVDETLDRMHIAAANADLETYFDCFANDGYFIGTDQTERWTIQPDFYNYAKPYFDQGMGWTYTPVSRHITYLTQQHFPTASTAATTTCTQNSVALFDEILSHERFGTTRNSGVMVLQRHQQPQGNGYVWRIAQYHLTIPIPNRCVDTIVQIRRDTK